MSVDYIPMNPFPPLKNHAILPTISSFFPSKLSHIPIEAAAKNTGHT
jgi:hypothetical protein